MRRWLKAIRAEFIRDLTITLRYPVEVFFGLFVLYILFMGLFMGARMLAGDHALSGDLDGLVIGYSMWFFALMAINAMSIDIESEARQGTLEQVYMHAPNFLALLWVRALVHITMGAGAVVVLALLIQATTRHFLPLSWEIVSPVLLVIVLTVVGLAGFGLILGGLSLVFKRIGQLSSVVQFSLFFLAYADLSQLSGNLRSVVAHLPLARGVDILRSLFAARDAYEGFGSQLGWLAADTLGYVLVGCLVFIAMDRIARKGGMLSHY